MTGPARVGAHIRKPTQAARLLEPVSVITQTPATSIMALVPKPETTTEPRYALAFPLLITRVNPLTGILPKLSQFDSGYERTFRQVNALKVNFPLTTRGPGKSVADRPVLWWNRRSIHRHRKEG
jgi:hypothetical protein